jgi:hypothetical protein
LTGGIGERRVVDARVIYAGRAEVDMDWGIGIITTGIVVVIYFGLYNWGKGSLGSTTVTVVGDNNASASCDEAALQFEHRRQERCQAKLAEDAAKKILDASNADLTAAVTAVVAFAVAALAALALPWPANLIAGLIALTLLTIASIFSAFCLGRKDAANTAWMAASKKLMDADKMVSGARNIIFANCPPERAAMILAIPDPC